MAETKENTRWKLKIGIFLVILLILAAGIIGFQFSTMLYEKKQPKITSTYISEQIYAISDLAAAEMVYHGLITYSDGNIPFLTQKQFSMIYSANIRAGIDISKIKIDVSDGKVVIDIPDAEIQSIDVDPDSIEFYDERFALFNWTQKEDIADIISAANQDTAANADISSLMERADSQTAILIEHIVAPVTGDMEVVIK